jgi:type IV pilus assembly protein PilW
MNTRKQRGLSLIELLVALAIGGFLIIGAVTVQSQTRKTFSVTENQARLQETARFVLSVIEPDVQLAGLYGYTNDGGALGIPVSGGNVINSSDFKVGDGAVSGAPAVMNDCGNNYVYDVNAPVRVDNGTWFMSCGAQGGGFVTGTDVLTVRRSGTEKAAATAGRIQLYTHRTALQNQKLFWNGTAPGPLLDNIAEVRDLIMQAYYVSKDSDGRPGLPSMRLKQITAAAGSGTWDDQEIVRGVEDIQIEVGIDTGQDTMKDGTPDDVDGDGMVDLVNGDVRRYVQPGDAAIARGQIVAIRIWVRVRAEEAEPGFKDDRAYKYGNTDVTFNDGYRRVVMSRTIFLRNSRSFPSTDS